MKNLKITKLQNCFIARIKSRKGFTLIELLIVISIVGLLAGFISVNFAGVRQRGRDTVRKSDLRQIQTALEFWRSDTGSYSSSLPSCNSSFDNGASPPVVYLKSVPCDPSGGDYTYSSNGISYTIIACLENTNDTQQDPINSKPPCDGTKRVSYTLKNP